MCYLIRQSQPEAERFGTAVPPSLRAPPRSRWIAGVAAALIGGLAVAALVIPPSSPPQINARHSGAAAPIASASPAGATIVPASVPNGPVVEQVSAGLDDGVPTASDVAKAGLGHCEHGL